jgi:beta-phosphoglucomutase-like phosphatase (HAD superfamily)
MVRGHARLQALRIVGIDQHFGERMTTFEDVVHGKPAPDIYLLAAKRAGFAPHDCAVVEDSVTGVAAAVAAGCVTFGFTGSQVHRSEHALKLVELGAHVVFDDMAKLPGLLAKVTCEGGGQGDVPPARHSRGAP